jgi:hypothetical protein
VQYRVAKLHRAEWAALAGWDHTAGAREPLRRARVSIVNCIKHQLYAGGDAELFEDAVEVLLDGVLA